MLVASFTGAVIAQQTAPQTKSTVPAKATKTVAPAAKTEKKDKKKHHRHHRHHKAGEVKK